MLETGQIVRERERKQGSGGTSERRINLEIGEVRGAGEAREDGHVETG